MKQKAKKTRYSKDWREGRKLILISAFWKNDKPTGFGMIYKFEDKADTDVFVKMCDEYIKHYNEADPTDRLAQISEYEEQLNNHKEWCLDIPGFEICLIGNVWFLEYMGFITVDNFNGFVAVWQ